ncbi:Biotin/lipoate A/B protein ligase family protein [Halorubrum aquaticum]|uniref:Biotin/lipoate A/B protein ligase family protein n=1 Tax=Halorubrum aquaticum TaxID=387340 RepID=A0A1I3BKU3_9EURY|nr:lipoate--protein ligase family protein [Halorubrum aquaticum]SFH62873.1 Biotin/lipoate A/B protein ligase family protein [Halorubrum aquaticum]
MQVLRGRGSSPRRDHDHTARLLADAADGTSGVRVWTPPRQVAFGRRDTREPGYDRARRVAETAGFPPIARDVGGRAVAYSGDTLAFALAVPTRDLRGSIDGRYATVTRAVRSALEGVGADVSAGEPHGSFCPGERSLRVVDGGKLAGIAQRVRADAALVAGCLVVSRNDAAELAAVLEGVYDALDVPFDPDSVGSVAAAGGSNDAGRIARAVENALSDAGDDGSWRIERVGPESR